MRNNDNHAIAKAAAGYAAADLIPSGSKIGIGTGSTAAFFIERLIQRCREGLVITALATSAQSEKLAAAGGIPLLDPSQVSELDIAVDGADRIDQQKQMIKGGGGALLREKIVASMAKEMIIIVDEEKVVDRLGGFPLPIEILPFGYQSIIQKLRALGLEGNLRHKQEEIYKTDNGNYIVDIVTPAYWDSPEKTDSQLRKIPGVIETGFFLNLAKRVIVGDDNGKVRYV